MLGQHLTGANVADYPGGCDQPLATSCRKPVTQEKVGSSNSSSKQLGPQNNPYLADPDQGPSGILRRAQVASNHNSLDNQMSSSNTSKAVAGSSRSTSRSAETSIDSLYDQNSLYDGFMFELSEKEIAKRVMAVESGLVQITLKKCAYSLGFDRAPTDLSRESFVSDDDDEGSVIAMKIKQLRSEPGRTMNG